MTPFSLFYTINRLISAEKRCQQPVKKIKSFETELSIFKKNIAKYTKTLKFTKSPQTMIKTFSTIKEEFGKILAYNHNNIDLEFGGHGINSMEDIQKIDIIQEKYIKEFLNNQIDIELEKEKEVTSIFLKESLIKKALTQALKSIEYIPNNVEMRLRILELEEKLINCYKEE